MFTLMWNRETFSSWRKNTTSWKIHLIFFIKKAPTLCFTCAALWNTSRVSIKVFFSCAFWSIALEKVNGNGKVKFKKTKMVTWGDFWLFVLNGRWEHIYQRSSDVVSRSPDQLFLPRDSNSGNSVTGLYLPETEGSLRHSWMCARQVWCQQYGAQWRDTLKPNISTSCDC